MLSKSTVPHFYSTIKSSGVCSTEVVVQNVAVADEGFGKQCTAIEAAIIEEENLLRVAEQKQEKLAQFQSRLNARLAASRKQKLEHDKENRAKEASTIVQIQNSCRTIFPQVPHITNEENDAPKSQKSSSVVSLVQSFETGNVESISSKTARSKLRGQRDDVMSDTCTSLPSVICIDVSQTHEDTLPRQEVEPQSYSCKSSRKEFRTAHQKATFRKTVMKLERERAHEIAQLQQRKKNSSIMSMLNYAEPVESKSRYDEDQLKLDLPADICGDGSSSPQPLISCRTADTYLVEERPVNIDSCSAEVTERSHVTESGRPWKSSSKVEQQRFLSAMKSSARDLAKAKNITVPPLCPCSDSFWEFDAKKCANNCPFYKNKKLFDRIAQSVLHSLDINMKW